MDYGKVSVIVPIYKVESYLDQCVQSIVDQTYKNLEIILVDDGSPDHCPAMCDAWAAKDGRVQVIHKENGGVSSARNAALMIACGDYITFVDADDWIVPQAMETLLNLAACTEADVAMAAFYFAHLDASVPVLCAGKKNEWHGQEILAAFLSDEIRPEVCNKLYSRSVIDNLLFDPSVDYAEDLLFNYQALARATVVASTDAGLYYYLQASGHSSTTAYMTKARAESYRVTAQIVKDLQGSPLAALAVWRYVRTVYALISRVCHSDGSAFFEPYFRIYRSEILSHKSGIFQSNRYSLKQKIATCILWIAPKVFVQISKRFL